MFFQAIQETYTKRRPVSKFNLLDRRYSSSGASVENCSYISTRKLFARRSPLTNCSRRSLMVSSVNLAMMVVG